MSDFKEKTIAQGCDGWERAGDQACEDSRFFLGSLHSCQVECSIWVKVWLGGEFGYLARAISKKGDFRRPRSVPEALTEGRVRWHKRDFAWSIRRYAWPEVRGGSEHGSPEDVVWCLFVFTAEEADFNARLAEQEREKRHPSPVRPQG